jgi:hypothetical protein
VAAKASINIEVFVLRTAPLEFIWPRLAPFERNVAYTPTGGVALFSQFFGHHIITEARTGPSSQYIKCARAQSQIYLSRHTGVKWALQAAFRGEGGGAPVSLL